MSPGTGTEQPVLGENVQPRWAKVGIVSGNFDFIQDPVPRRSLFPLCKSVYFRVGCFSWVAKTFPTNCTPGETLPDIGGTSLAVGHRARKRLFPVKPFAGVAE